nr:MAG TPA: hypothetical protein [Caudoviricetes sp.]
MKTIELYNRNNDYYWNVEKFVTEQGYQNVCAYCADVLDRLGSVEWCKEQATQDMYTQQDLDFENIYENTLLPLNEKYYIVCIPTQGRWNGTYKGGLQDCKHIDMCINYEVQKVTIKDKALIIDVSHHDGNNQYVLYFVESNKPTIEEYYNELQDNYLYEYYSVLRDKKDIENYINTYAIDLYDLWYKGNI